MVKAINGAGGWHKVSKTLGLQISHTLREVYFKCPQTKGAGQEIEFTLPGMPQRFAATIPEGVGPGDEFIVRWATGKYPNVRYLGALETLGVDVAPNPAPPETLTKILTPAFFAVEPGAPMTQREPICGCC